MFRYMVCFIDRKLGDYMHLCKSSSLFNDPHYPYLLHVNSAMLPRPLI